MNEIKIGTHTVRIIEERLPSSESLDGLTDWDASTVYVEKDLAPTAYNASLMHELLEFINECTDKFIFGNADDMKEQKISTLCEFLLPLIRRDILK
jgi:hypothetical protein